MDKIIQTLHGPIKGIETENCYQFRGVPFVKPPVGDLRFHAPVECEDWTEVLDCTEYKAKCYQMSQNPKNGYGKEFYNGPEAEKPMLEDCLQLNIWMPKQAPAPGEKYPVALWWHGGGFLNGYAFEKEFGGEEYAKRGVILVSANYRTGLFGYFAHPELKKRDGHTGNYALLDQLAALDWVIQNIDAFGGDSKNITIFGQSAGAYSVRCLCVSPLAKGKFQKAIMQSCGGYGYGIVKEVSQKKLVKLCKKYIKSKKLDLDALMALPEEQLGKLSTGYLIWGMLHSGSLFTMVPSLDDYVLPNTADHAIDQGNVMKIPYLIGGTKDDFGVSGAGKKDQTKNEIYTSSIEWCKKTNELGAPSYSYYFAHDLPGKSKGIPGVTKLNGSFHSSELWYMFGTLGRCWRPMTDADYNLSEEMVDAWTSFMKTGDPGWDKCTAENPYVKEFK